MGFNQKPVQDFIGRGLTFPIRLVNGAPPIDSGFTIIRASIATILSFQFGERFMLGEFGSRLNDLIEEPNDQILENVINTFIVDAITRWEKRITQISATLIRPDAWSIDLNLVYQVKNVQNSDNFVYPFYRQLNT